MELAQSSLGEQYLRFSKNDLSWLKRIFLLFAARKSCVFQIFLLRSIEAYLCANIINFDRVDFSGRRPEEVISFFWRSVYIPGYAIRRCSELRPDSFEGQSGRSDCIRAAFERQSKDSDGIRIAFQLNSFNIEIIPAAIEMHSMCIPVDSRRIRDILAGF